MTATLPALNSRVIISADHDPHLKYHGVVFTVVRHYRTNVGIQEANPVPGFQPVRARINPRGLLPAPEGDAQPAVPEIGSLLPVGAVFTVPAGTLRRKGGGEIADDTLMVVIGHHGVAHRAAQLGGDNGRYWPSVSRSAMRPVDITARLAAPGHAQAA
jgi:hypothetical protein